MDSKERKKAALYQKLEQLRVAANSNAVNKASIVVDASRYIEELKERIEKLNEEDVSSGLQTSSTHHNPAQQQQQIKVERLEKGGFLINVFSEKNCPGLLVSILEAFEELGLQVLDARVSCSDNFRLQAVSEENEGQSDSGVDAQAIKQAVTEAIRNWSDGQND